MNSTDQEWDYWQIPDGEDTMNDGRQYTGVFLWILVLHTIRHLHTYPQRMRNQQKQWYERIVKCAYYKCIKDKGFLLVH